MTANTRLISPAVARKLAYAETVAEVESAISAVEAELGDIGWRALGDQRRNNGTVEMGRDAATQIIERFVNGQEACLELKALRTGEVPPSPYEAAQRWFGVPANGLSGMSDADVRRLAEDTVQVIVAPSGDRRRPTTPITTDRGMGQHPSLWPDTLLSLHRSEKGDKPYLWGQYGHGGATTLLYSTYTVLVSRRAPDLLHGLDDVIGLTVLRYSAGPLRGGTYEYLVAPDGDLGAILAADPAAAPPPLSTGHGTRIAHVAYDLRGFDAAYRRQKTGLWGLLNAALFDPVLPIQILGKRPIDTNADRNAATVGRIAKGNVAVLSGLPTDPTKAASGDEDDGAEGAGQTTRSPYWLRYADDQTLEVGDRGEHGSIRVRVWVLSQPGKTESYVRADQAVTLTLSGQRHGRAGREFIRHCRLGFLSKRMIVQVDADGLTREARRELFPSGREDQRAGDMSDLVFKTVSEYLQGNEDLTALEDEAKQQDLANASAAVQDSVRREVARLIQRHLSGSGGKAGRGATARLTATGGRMGRTARMRVVPPPADDSAFPSIPTTLNVEKSPTKIVAGRAGQIQLLLDAKNGYLQEHAQNLVVEVERRGSKKRTLKVRKRGQGGLSGGRARLLVGADRDTPPGLYTVRVALAVPGGENLLAVTTVHVVPEKASRGGQMIELGGLPDIRWIRHPDDAVDDDESEKLATAWPSEWAKTTVGDILESGGSLVIRLNESYPLLRDAIERRSTGRRASIERVAYIKNRYAAAVGYGIWLLDRSREALDPDERPSEKFLLEAQAALARVQLETSAEPEDPAVEESA